MPKKAKKTGGVAKKDKKASRASANLTKKPEFIKKIPNEKKMLVRGTRYTPEQTRKNKLTFLRAVQGKLTLAQTCRDLGISYTAIHKWKREDPVFAEALAEAREMAIDDLEESMHERAKDRDTVAGIFLLKGNRPERYHERRHDVVSGPGGGPITVTWTDLAKGALSAGKKALALPETVIDAEVVDDD